MGTDADALAADKDGWGGEGGAAAVTAHCGLRGGFGPLGWDGREGGMSQAGAGRGVVPDGQRGRRLGEGRRRQRAGRERAAVRCCGARRDGRLLRAARKRSRRAH